MGGGGRDRVLWDTESILWTAFGARKHHDIQSRSHRGSPPPIPPTPRAWREDVLSNQVVPPVKCPSEAGSRNHHRKSAGALGAKESSVVEAGVGSCGGDWS